MISKVSLAPEKNFGFVILTNKITFLPSALKQYIYDLFFEKNVQDYSARYKAFYDKREEKKQKDREEREAAQIADTKPSFTLEKYTGKYHDEMYGDAEVSIKDGELFLRFLPAESFRGKLNHWQFDTFSIDWDNEFLTRGYVEFEMNTKGEIIGMTIDVPNFPDFLFDELDFKKE